MAIATFAVSVDTNKYMVYRDNLSLRSGRGAQSRGKGRLFGVVEGVPPGPKSRAYSRA